MPQKFNPEEANIMVYVGSKLLPYEAKASMFDNSVQKGSTLDRLLVYQKELFCIEGYRGWPKANAHVLYSMTTMEKHQRLTQFHTLGRAFTNGLMKEGIAVNKMDSRMHPSSNGDWHMCNALSPPYP